jgi:hypothetical protein
LPIAPMNRQMQITVGTDQGFHGPATR